MSHRENPQLQHLLLVVCFTVGCNRREESHTSMNEPQSDGSRHTIEQLEDDLDMMLEYEQWQTDREWREAIEAARGEQGTPNPSIPLPYRY